MFLESILGFSLSIYGALLCRHLFDSLNTCLLVYLEKYVLARKNGKIWYLFSWQHYINITTWHYSKCTNHFKCVTAFQSVMFCLICWLVRTWLLILHSQMVVKMMRFVVCEISNPTTQQIPFKRISKMLSLQITQTTIGFKWKDRFKTTK